MNTYRFTITFEGILDGYDIQANSLTEAVIKDQKQREATAKELEMDVSEMGIEIVKVELLK